MIRELDKKSPDVIRKTTPRGGHGYEVKKKPSYYRILTINFRKEHESDSIFNERSERNELKQEPILAIRWARNAFLSRRNGPTDGRTDGRTDAPSYRDATAHLKSAAYDTVQATGCTKSIAL